MDNLKEETIDLISVIIPAYNRGNPLKLTIESVLNQEYKDFELIIVDDGSTDNTYDVACAYHDPRIIVIKKENGGTTSARNCGIKKAKGSYIAFIDHDDMWKTNHLFLLKEALKDNPDAGMAYSKVETVDEKGNKIGIVGQAFNKQTLEYRNFMLPSAILLRKSCLNTIGLFDENPNNLSGNIEWEFYLRFSDSYPIIHLNEATVIGVKHPEGLLIKSLQNKKYFQGKKYVIEKRFALFKTHPRGDKIAPFDGYYFGSFMYLLRWVFLCKKLNFYSEKEILEKEILELYETIAKIDSKNLELWLLLVILCLMINEKHKLSIYLENVKKFLSQDIIINDGEIKTFVQKILTPLLPTFPKMSCKEVSDMLNRKFFNA